MALLQIVYSLLLTLLCTVYMLHQYMSGRRELISARNFALLGFLVFQVANFGYIYWRPYDENYNLERPEEVGTKFLTYVTVFLIFGLGTYELAGPTRSLARKIRVPDRVPGVGVLFVLGWVLTWAAIFGKFAVFIPYISILTALGALAVGATAAGIGAWIWTRNPLNPLSIMMGVPLILVNTAIVQLDKFSRRPILGIAAAALFAAWYARLRFMRPGSMLPGLALVGMVGVLGVAAVTANRSWDYDYLRIPRTEDLKEALMEMGSGSDTARRSMWAMQHIEENPEKTSHLRTLQYLAMYPVPRQWVTWKPYPLSTYMADWARRDGVALGRTGTTNPAGIIGNSAAEGGVYALILYAILVGAALRLADEIIERNKSQTLLVLPIGSAMGQLIGMARGEPAVFAFNWIFTTVAAFVLTLWLLKVTLRITGGDAAYALEDGDEPGPAAEPALLTEPDAPPPMHEQLAGAYEGYGTEPAQPAPGWRR